VLRERYWVERGEEMADPQRRTSRRSGWPRSSQGSAPTITRSYRAPGRGVGLAFARRSRL